jgi:hypothetical protein
MGVGGRITPSSTVHPLQRMVKGGDMQKKCCLVKCNKNAWQGISDYCEDHHMERNTPVMTATEIRELIEHPLNCFPEKALEAIRDLLAECERLREDACHQCVSDVGTAELQITKLQADCRVMAEAVINGSMSVFTCTCGNINSCTCDCTCPACEVAKKYMGGENG